MLSVAICDDEAAVLAELKNLTGRCLADPDREIRTFTSRRELARAVAGGWEPDVALLDIRLPEGDGIGLAGELFPGESRTQVIFVTGYMEYYSEVYEAEHIWFLTKPVREAELRRALKKAAERLDRRRTQLLPVRSGGTVRQIPLGEIRAAESRGRKVLLYCREEEIEYYGTMEALAARLPRSFVRCHRSYFVNLAHVVRLEEDRFTMDGGETVPIARARRKAVREAFLDDLRRER